MFNSGLIGLYLANIHLGQELFFFFFFFLITCLFATQCTRNRNKKNKKEINVGETESAIPVKTQDKLLIFKCRSLLD